MKSNYKFLKILLIGAGNTGGNLLPVLLKKFSDITVVNRNKKTNIELKKLYKVKIFNDLKLINLDNYDVFILCVQDKFIKTIFNKILKSGFNFRNKYFINLSGSLSSEVFKSEKTNSKKIVSAHPVQSFAGLSKNGDKLFNKISIGIDGGEKAISLVEYIFNGYKINYLKIKPENKILYHIACVIASNFLVTQFFIMNKILNKIGLKDSNSFDIFEEIIFTTLENIKNKKLSDALTGPVKRKDFNTINLHKKEITEKFPLLINYYNQLTDLTKLIK